MSEKYVKAITYNWYQCGSVQDSAGAGEDYETITVGINGVESIEECPARGEGDKWNYLVKFNDCRSLRIFNPNTVEYFANPF